MLYGRYAECLLYAIRCRMEGDPCNGVQKAHHIHTGNGAGYKPKGCWLEMCRAGWRTAVDGKTQTRSRFMPSTNETAI